jgi:hypothetical protein
MTYVLIYHCIDIRNIPSHHIRCPNAKIPSRADRSIPYVREWASIYLQNATKRIQEEIKGLDIDFVDVYTMQQICAYEVCTYLICSYFYQTMTVGTST